MDPFCERVGHQEGCNDGAEGHPRRILLAVHRNVAEKDGKVHQTRGGLLLRGNHVLCCLELK